MTERMTLTHDPVGARIEFRRLDESEWHRSEVPVEGVTVFRSASGDVAAVIVDLSLADGEMSDAAVHALKDLLGTDAVEAARALHEGDIEIDTSISLTTRLVTTIDLGRSPDDVQDLALSATDRTELVVSARMPDVAGRWAVVVDVERSRPVAAARFSDRGDAAYARVRFGMDPAPGRYRVDVTSTPFDVPPDIGGTPGGTRTRGRRIWPWLAAAVVVLAVGAGFAFGWPGREIPPSGPATTTPTPAIESPSTLARQGVFERGEERQERVVLAMQSPSVVTVGDVIEFEFRRSRRAPDTAFDPSAETLEQLIASCERRVGIANPVNDPYFEELLWYFRVVPVDPPGPTIEHDVLIASVLAGTQLAACGDDWADEDARELQATRDFFYVPETVRFSINRLMEPGSYEIHVVNPTGEPWPTAEPLPLVVESAP
ncbi:MAG: hypothetical protein WEA76_07745 [Acidimicrobiia bacterium]